MQSSCSEKIEDHEEDNDDNDVDDDNNVDDDEDNEDNGNNYDDNEDEDDDNDDDYENDDEDKEELSNNDDDLNQEEQLENAENQKISSEKISNNLRRLNVNFDDLSVVEEEEELKKYKERGVNEGNESICNSFVSEQTGTPLKCSYNHCTQHPFIFPNAGERFGHNTYSQVCNLTSTSPMDTPILDASCSDLETSFHDWPFKNSTVRWQRNVFIPAISISNQVPNSSISSAIRMSRSSDTRASISASNRIDNINTKTVANDSSNLISYEIGKVTEPLSQFESHLINTSQVSDPSLLHRRQYACRQPVMSFVTQSCDNSKTTMLPTAPTETISGNKWIIGANHIRNQVILTDSEDKKIEDEMAKDFKTKEAKKVVERNITDISPELPHIRPKHFFAPLPSKFKTSAFEKDAQHDETSTSVTKNFKRFSNNHKICPKAAIKYGPQFLNQSAAVHINETVPSDKRKSISSENLLTSENQNGSAYSSLQPLAKSISCEELNTYSGNSLFFEKMRYLKNELDNRQQVESNHFLNDPFSNAFKSHLNVTLKHPHASESSTPEIPSIPKLPSENYRFLSNSFLKNSGYTSSNYADFGPEQFNWFNESEDTLLELSTLNPDFEQREVPPSQHNNNKIKKYHKYQVTSFEDPNPHTLQILPVIPNEADTLHRLRKSNPLIINSTFTRNAPFVQGDATAHCAARGMQIYYDSVAKQLVPQKQTPNQNVYQQTSRNKKDSRPLDAPNLNECTSLLNQRRKKMIKIEKSSSSFEKKSVSPTIRGRRDRLKKQVSISSFDDPESPNSIEMGQTLRNSTFTASNSEVQEDKNESRSSSSGLDSSKKEQTRRVSLHFNSNKRPSLTSVKSIRSTNTDNLRTKHIPRKDNLCNTTTKFERERTNSISSREIGSAKGRKTSSSSESVPWCACWGNGCI